MQVYLRDIPSQEGFHMLFSGGVRGKTHSEIDYWYYSLDPNLIMYYVFPNQHILFSQTSFSYERDKGENLFNSFFQHFRPRIHLIDGWLDMNFVLQYEFNKKARIENRLTGGVGLRVNLYSYTKKKITYLKETSSEIIEYERRRRTGDPIPLNNNLKSSKRIKDIQMFRASMGVLYLFEYEQISTSGYSDDNKNLYEHRMSVFFDISVLLFENTYFVTTIYYQPLLSNFSDYRILNDNTLEFKLSRKVSLRASNVITYDSLPPIAIRKLDIGFKIGLTFRLL